jgi:hypothetical protein
MARIRIVTKRPPQPERVPGYPRINGVQTSLVDCYFYAVADDGTEEPLHGVTAFAIDCSEPTEALRATIQFVDVDIDIEAETSDIPEHG